MPPTAPTVAPPRRGLVYACFAVSGAAGLALEIVWSKYLSLLSGNSVQGVATVVAAFLGGLGLGAWLGGRWAARVRDPLLAYARLEAVVGLLGLASPLAFLAAKPLVAWLHAATGGSGALFLALRFALLFAALLPPTIAMGASLPLVATDFTRRGVAFGGSVGRLYAWNTAGAVAGVALAGFALIPFLGLWKSAALAGAADLAVAAAILRLRPPPAPAAAETRASGRRPGAAASPWLARAIVPLFAVSGFTALLYEVAWTRVLCVPLGGMVYSLSAILAVYLAGIAAGAAAAARLLERGVRPAALFGVAQSLLAASVVAGAHLFGWVPARMTTLLVESRASPVPLFAGEIGIVAAIVLVPSLLLGALFPAAAAIRRGASGEAGAAVGAVYAANTLGSIAGSVLTGFVLIPLFSSLTTILAAALVNALLGLVALASCEWPAAKRLRACVAVVAAGAGVALLALPEWPAFRMTMGFTRLVRESLRAGTGRSGAEVMAALDAAQAQERLVFFREGATASVGVLESGGDVVLVVNGKPDASTGARSDMVTQLVIGHLPLVAAREPKDVCIVGYGSGVTTNACLAHPVREVLTLEIEGAVIEAAPHFRGGAGEPLADPRSRLAIEDAGTFLRSTDRTFDVIVSEPSNPWVAGVGDLFTAEFYEHAAARLRPGGVFTQWVQCYEISSRTQGVILRTLARRFRSGHVFFVRAASDMVVIASADGDLTLDPARLSAAFERPEVRDDLARVGFASPADLLRCYVGRLERLAARAGDGPVNTDDNAWLEHHAPLDVVTGGWRADFGTPEEIGADLAASLGSDAAAASALLSASLDRAVERADADAAAAFAAALEKTGAAQGAAARRRLARLEPRLAAVREAAGLVRDAMPILGDALQQGDATAAEEAVGRLVRAGQLDPDNGQIAWRLGNAYLALGRVAEATRELRRALAAIPPTTSFTVRNDLARASFLARDFAACLEQAAALDALKPGAAEAFAWRVRVHAAQGDDALAREELARGRRATRDHPLLDALAREL